MYVYVHERLASSLLQLSLLSEVRSDSHTHLIEGKLRIVVGMAGCEARLNRVAVDVEILDLPTQPLERSHVAGAPARNSRVARG